MKKMFLMLGFGATMAMGLTYPQTAIAQSAEQGQEADSEALTPEEQAEYEAYLAEEKAFNDSLNRVTGQVSLAKVGAELDLGEEFYFLNATDAQRVLEEAWENPPDDTVLGMIFEKGTDAYSSDYAVAITFDETGYVSDEEAHNIDFDELLKTLKSEARDSNEYRIAEGYNEVELLGWAAPPNYDSENKRVLWSKLLKFSDTDGNTINYNMRFLGRKGVLEFNYIADEDALDKVTAAMPAMLNVASFKESHRYEDFNPATDKVAEYGVAGLIVGGVVAKKLGLFAVLLVLLKKGWVIIVAGLVYGRKFIRKLFGREEPQEVEPQEEMTDTTQDNETS